jgi:hypothetical protein
VRITKCRDFSREDDRLAFSVVRVNNNVLKDFGGRRVWVTISTGKLTIYRVALGAGRRPLNKDAIELDYDSRLDLRISSERDGQGFCECDLLIKRSTFVERLRAHWSHPSLAYKVPLQLAALSLVISLLGASLTVITSWPVLSNLLR